MEEDTGADIEETDVEATDVAETDVAETEAAADEPAAAETAEQVSDETADAEQDTESDEGATAGADIYAGLPEAIAVLMPDADPARGEQLSLQNGCIGCHNLDPNLVMAGPTWYNVGSTAETRVEGMTAAQYIHTSIVNTNDYIVEGFAANIMVSTYGETLSEQDQADLVAYLLGLRE